jgi:transposase
MAEHTIFVGLDVHKESIAVAVAPAGTARPEFWGTIPATEAAVAALLRKLQPLDRVQCCYEAGPCGYGLARQMVAAGADCVVAAPSLVPQAPGDKVKTDRRDARKLAGLLRAGVLTAVPVPDEATEALRDLTRARQTAQTDALRATNRVSKMLLRLGYRPPEGVKCGSAAEWEWITSLTLPTGSQQLVLSEYCHQRTEARARIERLDAALRAEASASPRAALIRALQTLRGVDVLTATTLVAEFGDPARFSRAREAMAYTGLVPSEHSSGGRQHRGTITRTGNAHLRRILVEAAWHYQHKPALKDRLKQRQQGQPQQIRQQAWAAQQRLYRRFHRLLARGKPKNQAAVAIARELVGFIWSIARSMDLAGTPTTSPAV